MFDPIGMRINLALAAMNAPPPTDTPELDILFAKLGADGGDRAETEQQIWTIWCSHEDDAAARAMHAAIRALSANDFVTAGKTLDRMIRRWPSWAEAWNKRATLRFLEVPHSRRLRLRLWPGPARRPCNNRPGSLALPGGVCRMEVRDADSLSDIVDALEREPRHFGALGGFGQICLRSGDMKSALLAFERVLALNPDTKELRQAVDTISKRVTQTIH